MPDVGGLDGGAVAKQLADMAAKIPTPSTVMPKAEARTADPGKEAAQYALADHQHPRLTATARGTLSSGATGDTDAAGFRTVAFTRTFSVEPAVSVLSVDGAGATVPDFRINSWVRDANGLYTGCVIYGQRAKKLPTLAPLNGGVLLALLAVVNAVNALLAPLSGYEPYEAASGAGFSLIALQPSSAS